MQQVKLDRALVDEHADQIGRIDTAAFRAGVRLRVPVWLGNALLVVGTVVGALAVGAAFVWQTPVWKGLALVAAGAIWSVSLHSPTHWLVGYMVGIRWTDYFLGGPPPPRPGLEVRLRHLPASRPRLPGVDACLGRTRHEARAVPRPRVLAAPPALRGGRRPPWPRSACCRSSTDIALSTKSSDWKKFRREKAIARQRRAALQPGAPPAEQARVTGGSQIPSAAPSALPAEPVEPAPVEPGPSRRRPPIGCAPWTSCAWAT